jgi:putative glutathione S-transferase
MGLLHDGQWKPDATRDQYDHDAFDDSIRDAPDARHPPEANRYHLYPSRACPWAHRTGLVRGLLGLDDVISVDVVDPVRRDRGWEFTPEKDGCTAESVYGFDALYEIFRWADPTYTGRVTVPILCDTDTKSIVNEESADIARMIAAEFDQFQSAERNLYPARQRGAIDDAMDDIHSTINTGVYRAGFADSQAGYEQAVTELFDALDRLDERLANQRYVVGDDLTLGDVFLFTTLFRFDAVYHSHFKCNRNRLVDFDNL